jgi:hypothetical protein
MQIVFLNEQTLKVTDFAYASDDFEIVLDALVPQSSTFHVNKVKVNTDVGDYLVVRENDYFYIGIISALEKIEEGYIKISTKDFLSKFDVEVPVSSYAGNISQFIVNLINAHFRYSPDAKQNLSYLQTEIMINKTGSLNYEPDKKVNILKLLEEFSKTYGIRLAYELVVLGGGITNIKIKVLEVTKGLSLKSNLGTISNLSISDTNDNALNKIIFYPKVGNVLQTNAISYYLLSDGTISTNATSPNRIKKVSFKCEFYSDGDYPSLLTKATSALIDSSLEHNITFDFSFIVNKIEALNELSVGTFVSFITPNKTYETIVTKMTYEGTFKQATIVLGEHRISLTDKLKLLNRRGT